MDLIGETAYPNSYQAYIRESFPCSRSFMSIACMCSTVDWLNTISLMCVISSTTVNIVNSADLDETKIQRGVP